MFPHTSNDNSHISISTIFVNYNGHVYPSCERKPAPLARLFENLQACLPAPIHNMAGRKQLSLQQLSPCSIKVRL
ncbi:hypothetical protein GF325_00740 [Candidatus Bathyarchaeota archaeon]|nr:hypothetical protein [Candidatus Bathyarchaeota archaeon]